MVYTFRNLLRFAKVCNRVTDFNARNKCLTAKLLHRYHKLQKTFSKFYRRHYELICKYKVGLKTLFTARSKAMLLWWSFLFYVLVFKFFVLLAPYVCFHIFS